MVLNASIGKTTVGDDDEEVEEDPSSDEKKEGKEGVYFSIHF